MSKQIKVGVRMIYRQRIGGTRALGQYRDLPAVVLWRTKKRISIAAELPNGDHQQFRVRPYTLRAESEGQ